MKQFMWSRRGAGTWSDADVELLLKAQNDFLLVEEIQPVRTALETEKTNAAKTIKDFEGKITELEKEKKLVLTEKETLEKEILPIRATAQRNKLVTTVTNAKLVAADKLEDALLLAKVNDQDDEKVVLQKLKDFVGARAEYAFVETNTDEEAVKAKAASEATELAKLVAGAKGGNAPKEEVPPKAPQSLAHGIVA